MKSPHLWKENKFVCDSKTGRWIPNVDYPGISSHSYIIASNQIKYYQEFIGKYISGKLLDCGCGDVPYYGIYRDRISDVYCVDWENTGAQKRSHIDQYVDLNKKLDIQSSSFDSVLLSDVLEHIAEPRNLLQELARVLRPQGTLVVFVPFLYRIHEEPHDYYRYTEFALKHLLQTSGFEVLELQSYGGAIDVLFDNFNKLFFNTPRRSRMLFRLYHTAISLSRVRRINEERRLSFPLGYCVAARKA
jgi:SAM-dependent methyltransferase